MTNGLFSLFSSLIANTPPCRKGLSSRKFLSLFLILFLGIGQMWADSGVITAAATTDLGSGKTPRHVVEVAGVGRLMKNKTGSSAWSLSSEKLTTGSNLFALQTYNEITSIIITGTGTGSNRAFSKLEVGTATNNYAEVEASGEGKISGSTTGTIIITPSASIAANSYVAITLSGNINIASVELVYAGGGDPVCPGTLTISSKNDKVAFMEGDAIELTAALSEGNGAITYQWYKGGTAEGNKLAGKTAAKLEIASCVEGDAGDYYCIASKDDCSDAVNAAAFAITVAHNPCATHHWFVATADATANGKINWSGFTNPPTGSNNQNNSVTIDGKTYTLTKRTGSVGGGQNIIGFTIPANKTGTLYGYMKSSGSTGRTLSLKKDDDVIKTNTEITGSSWTLITIDAIAPGTYTLSPDQNVQVQMFVLKICDATFHTITFNSNGGSTVADLSVLDGTTAIQPTDPTWEHHRFDGWYNGENPYDWTANVTSDLTLTAHWTQLYTITYAAGDGTATGDAPTQVDKAEGETFTVAANTFEVASKDFVKWNDGSADYAPGATYTVGTANVVLTAQWKALADKYTVIFKDGETELGTKLFEVSTNPSDADIDKTKALNTFAAWQKEGVDIALDDAFWATVAKDATVTLTARWAKAFATSYDMEAYAVSDGASLATLLENLTAAGYAYTNVNGIDYGHTHNYIYDGMKYKTNDGDLSFNVNAGKLVIVKTGNLPANALTMYINGVADPTVFVGANEAVETHVNNYFYSATEALYRLDIQASKGTCAIKAVTITDPYTVSFAAHGDADPADLQGTPSVTLPTPTNSSASFLGWFDAETGGNKIGEAGETYTPTADITLHAQWEAVSTDARLASITFSSDAGTLSPAFDPEVTNYTYTMPYGPAAVPTITGATSVSAKAQEPQIVSQASAWGETAVIRGVAESSDTKAYNITMLRAPKDGVSIIKVATTGGTNKTVTGLYAGEGDVNLSSSKKMDSEKYIGFTLDGTTLQAGDRINVHTTDASTTGGSHIIFYDNMTDKTELYDTEEIGGVGNNIFTINAAMVGQASAYVYRSNADNAHKWNGYIDYIEVTRPMNPVLTAITFDGIPGVIDEAHKKVTVELPFSSEVASMVVEPTIAWNAPATTNSIVVNDGNWVVGDNTYVLTDKDGDQTTYTITLTQAAASADATLATLIYNGTNITLEADQYNYEVELPKGTVDVPTVTYTTNNAGATVVKTDAAVLPGATTIIVTAEDGTTQQNYTINFTVSTSDIITIFDGSTMSDIATSPSGAISWEIVGSTMVAGDKNISYNDVTYTRALSCGNSTATKHLKIVVADNNKAQFEIIGMSNSSSDTRHAWLTNSTDKGEFANAIAGLTSNGYNPAKFTTDWLEEGTYYLHSDNTVAILLIRVKAEPVPAKCEAPTISGLADVAVCDLSSALLDGTATVSDGGTVTYKWYAEGDAETVLATTATYAPTTVGNYYVVATNSLADHRDNSTTSSVVVVRIKTAPVITTEVLNQHAEAGNNVTLSVVATDAESYQWYTCDDAAGTNPVDVVGATDASLEVTVTSGMSQYYKVIVSNTCGSAETVALVEEWHEVTPANVTGSRTWDWAAESMGEIATESGSVEYLMANVSSQVPNTEAFRSDMLYITANYANRRASDKYFQGWQIRFYTEVPGRVSLNCRAIHGTMSITINGTVIDDAKGSDMGTATTPFFVPAGWVTIVFDNQSSGYEGEAARVQKIVFNATPDYTRTGLTVGSLGTICLPSNVPAGYAFGATFYELVGKEPQYGKIVFDEVTGELVAGKPYLFQAQSDVLYCFYGTESVSDPDNSGAMKGTFVDLELTELSNIYYFAQKALWSCVDLSSLSVPANRAYVKMDEMPAITESNPAPGVRRITLGVNGQQVATGVDQVQGDEVPTKMIINGQLFILRGEKMYDAQGKLVK